MFEILTQKQIDEGWRVAFWPKGLTILVHYVNHKIVEAVLKTTKYGLIIERWEAE